MICHLLFDADGVLQDLPAAWRTVLEPHLGERTDAFLLTLWEKELPMIAGVGDYLTMLTKTLLSYRVPVSAAALYAQTLQNLERFDESFRIIETCRTAGYQIHLGTNQDRLSGPYMAEVLGYDTLFDVSCYSYDLGVAKPNIGFFDEAVRRIRADASEVLFIDDNSLNVEAAAAAGLQVIQWSHDDGMASLVAKLAEHGVDIDLR